MKALAALAALLLLAPLTARASGLPRSLNPGPPFPRILQQAPTIEQIAPGIEYGEYPTITSEGPLAVHVIVVEPHRSDVRVDDELARDALESRGETVGSIAKRTGAVAGINGDYFDIGNTNRPTNIVVRGGLLLQMPRRRYALAITRDGFPQIAEFTFSGEIAVGDRTTTLDAIDQLPPPNGGTALITPEFGSVAPEENLTLAELAPFGGTPPLSRYRVISVVDNLKTQPPGYYLAVGPGAYNAVDVPESGDVVTATGDLSPIGLGSIAAAIGGGPLILHGGRWYDDPDGPNGGEYDKRIPCTGAAIAADGRLFLIEVDGRQPSVSVGLTRHEFAALMRALGATEGLALDGGGSSTIVARRLGDSQPQVVNDPSDGIERPVGNGLFVYSTAPVGPAVRLVARPGAIRAVAGAGVPIRVAAVDAANHVAPGNAWWASVEPSSLGRVRDGRFDAAQPGSGNILLHGAGLKGTVPVEVQAPARITILPARPNVDDGGTVLLAAHAYDRYGYALALPSMLHWKATAGSIDGNGRYRAATHNADVTVRVGERTASVRVTVGSHGVGLPFAGHARFMAIPHGGAGSVSPDPSCAACVRLTYAFAQNERAAYAVANVPLPSDTIGLSFDVLDDGSGSRLRIALHNSINESLLVDAAVLDRPGWRHVTVRFSPAAAQATRLVALYVLPAKGMQLSNGQIVLRNVSAVVAGN